MFTGSNEITFSKETAKTLFSKFMTDFLQSPIEVTDISEDYRGVAIRFTEVIVQPEEELEKKNENTETDG